MIIWHKMSLLLLWRITLYLMCALIANVLYRSLITLQNYISFLYLLFLTCGYIIQSNCTLLFWWQRGMWIRNFVCRVQVRTNFEIRSFLSCPQSYQNPYPIFAFIKIATTFSRNIAILWTESWNISGIVFTLQ